ncbi:hypothetical protein FRC01_013841, partial [Tulasnella sp. 417]
DGVALLPNGQIFILYRGRIELYPPARLPWEESLSIPERIPLVAPQWIFEFKPPIFNMQHNVSRLRYCAKKSSATFAFHNGDSLFNLQVSLDGNSVPTVSTTGLGQMSELGYMGMEVDRSIRIGPDEKKAVFTTVIQGERRSALQSFASLADGGSDLSNFIRIIEREFLTPFASARGSWELDEWSGHVLCSLEDDPEGTAGRSCAVLYFVDRKI